MQENRRHARVCELIKRAAGEVIRRTFPVQEVGVVSVTEVGISTDLRSAVVFLSVFGKDISREKTLQRIRGETKQLQMQIASEVILKYAPHIRFELDDSLDRGNRVLEILRELGMEDGGAPSLRE